MKSLGISLLILGIVLIVIGLIVIFYDKIPLLGKLPGDIKITGKNSSFYFPVTTFIIISILLSIVFSFISRFFK